MDSVLLMIILGAIDTYCENTNTPGCKAVHKMFDKLFSILGIITIVAIVGWIIYFIVK